MKYFENIYHKDKIVAIILKEKKLPAGSNFVTEEDNDFQVGLHKRPKGHKFIPHVHSNKKMVKLKTLQEFLYIQKGKVKITFYDNEGQKITHKMLRQNEAVLIISAGQGLDVLEDAQILEIKQGPFSNVITTKIFPK